jgi:inorganic pyrophosphatase
MHRRPGSTPCFSFAYLAPANKGTAAPDYAQCVAISTQAAVREMVAPGILLKFM